MSEPFNLLWLQAGSCGGCTMSTLAADDVGLVRALERFNIRLLWHPSLSEESGADALAILEGAADGRIRVDALCVEGAILTGPNGTGRFQLLSGTGKPLAQWVAAIAAHARAVLAIGSCAAFGGVPTATSNPTDAVGLVYAGADSGGLLGTEFRSGAGLPVINVAGCAPIPAG
ncbi:MAG: hypothetical protein NVV74_17380 [Magnetospirillum sp.]|nr:hypothetical protein [Magnetospirillum sp.]